MIGLYDAIQSKVDEFESQVDALVKEKMEKLAEAIDRLIINSSNYKTPQVNIYADKKMPILDKLVAKIEDEGLFVEIIDNGTDWYKNGEVDELKLIVKLSDTY